MTDTIRYLASKLSSPSTLLGVARDPRRIWNYIRYILSDVTGETVRSERDAFHGAIVALSNLAARVNTIMLQMTPLDDLARPIAQEPDCQELAHLFCMHGSDKASIHDYYLIYASLLGRRRHEPLSILEIGLGTNNTDVPSNMGASGRPGASLRAFRDWLPNASVYGADIDRRILFQEQRIRTFFVDQTKIESLEELSAHFQSKSMDLIIDDGLHNAWANINSAAFAVPLLKENGVFVAEDVSPSDLAAWRVATALLAPEYSCQTIRTKSALAVLIRRHPQ